MSRWITINGAHIEIKEGESVKQAIQKIATSKQKEDHPKNETPAQKANSNIRNAYHEEKSAKTNITIQNENAAKYSHLFSPQINDFCFTMNTEVKTKYHKLTNYHTREWYHTKLKAIPGLLDSLENKTLDNQSKVAYAIREETRTQARSLMKNDEDRKMLEENRPSPTYEELIQHKMNKYECSEEEAKQKIIETADKPNTEFDKIAEKDKDEEDEQ